MIGIVECTSKSAEEAAESIKKLLRILDFKPKNNQILIKPNIVDAVSPKEASITDPKLVSGLIIALNELFPGLSFVIGENSGFFSSKPENFERLLKETGYKRVLKKLEKKNEIKVKIINLEFEELDEYDWKYGKLSLPSILKTHTYINFAKMKTHMHTTVTLSMKNQKGLLLLKDKKMFHLGYKGATNLHDCIKELSKIIQPELALVDGVTALEGSGPTTRPEGQTKVRRLNLIVGGTDLNEVDNACCHIMGIDPNSVKHLEPLGINEIPLANGSQPLTSTQPPFNLPKNVIKYGSIYAHFPIWVCTGCQISFSQMNRKISFNPEMTAKFQKLMQKYDRIDLFAGKTEITDLETLPPELETPKIFYGNCTKKIAKELGLEKFHVPGCPGDYRKGAEIFLGLLDI